MNNWKLKNYRVKKELQTNRSGYRSFQNACQQRCGNPLDGRRLLLEHEIHRGPRHAARFQQLLELCLVRACIPAGQGQTADRGLDNFPVTAIYSVAQIGSRSKRRGADVWCVML